MSQRSRISRGRAVLNFYRQRWDSGEADGDVLSDLLADLMHYVDAVHDPLDRGLDFDCELERARRHYTYEVEEEALERTDP